MVITSPSGRHPHVEYHQPIGILRLILASTLAGLALGGGTWALFKLQMKRLAKFHRPSLATWKGIGFWGPKKRKMTLDERKAFLQRMNLLDYLEYVRFVTLGFVVLLPFLIVGVSLILDAPAKGFIPALMQVTRGLIGAEILLAVVGFVFATVSWLLGRFFVWLGWTRTLA